MSKIKAALITAILGTSSAAMASPTVSWSANAQFSFGTHSAPVVRDHGDRTQAPVYAMPSTRSTSWVSLANYLDLSSGRDVLRPESNLRTSALTLRANMGHAYIQKVIVRFEDGSRQVINLDQWMSTRNPAIELALRGRGRIDSIVIVGTASGRASYSVLAKNERIELPRPPVYGHGGGYGYEQNYGMSLGTDMSFVNTDGRKFITVGSGLRSFGTLRLEGASGRTYIQAVKVIFSDGQEQFLTGLDRTLTRGESMDLKLDGRGANSVKQIIVWTDLKGDHMITSSGTFNATAL